MKVLQVGKFYHPYKGGMETYLFNLCQGLKDKVDLKVLVSHTAPRTVRENVGGVEVIRAGCWGRISSTSICPEFPSLMRENAGDVIQIQHPDPLAGLSYLAARPPGRMVIVYQSDIVRKRLIYAYYPFLVRFFRKAARIIVTSRPYLESSWFLKRYREKCVIIPIGVDLEPFRETREALEKARAVREIYGERIVLFIGRLALYKGVEYLIRAMEGVPATLLIIGRGERLAALTRLARETGQERRVFFLPGISAEDLPAYLHACAVFCLPSITRNEAFGICQLEAMACAKPVVNTRLDTGVSFINLDGVTGLSVPPRDPGALAEALNRLLESPGLREEMGRRARERVETVFSREKMVSATLALYQELLR